MDDLAVERHDWLCGRLVESCGDAVVIADREGTILIWNDAASKMFGYVTSEAIGRSLDLIIPERFRQRHWDGFTRVMESGVTKYGTELLAVPAVHADGRRMSIEFSIAMIRDAKGRVDAIAAVIRDVTRRWEQEREMRARIAKYEAAQPAS